MRIGFEVKAILERAGLALVAVDRHQPRAGLAEHRAPFPSRRKARAAETAQGCVVQRFQQIVLCQFTGAQPVEQRIAAAGDIGVVIDIVGQMRVGVAALRCRQHAGDAGVIDEVMADLGRGRGVAAADAGRAHHANAGTSGVLQSMQQFFRAQHRAGQGIANANGQRRDVGLALLHHVEMRVEGRGLEHFGEGELHLVGKGCEVGGGNLVLGVLDEVQIFDQQIAPARPVAKQKRDLLQPLADRSGGPWGSIWLASGLGPDVRTSGLFARLGSLKSPPRSC